MSWEQEDSLRRKVREARERQAFKHSIESVLYAKEAQAALSTRRKAEQDQLPPEQLGRDRQRPESEQPQRFKNHSASS